MVTKVKKPKEASGNINLFDSELFRTLQDSLNENEKIKHYDYNKSSTERKSYSLEDEIARRKALQNDKLAQNIDLKKKTLFVLFIFLAIETLLIFCFSFLQATFLLNFSLEEWSFKLLISATIVQITWMLSEAVKYLFPSHK